MYTKMLCSKDDTSRNQHRLITDGATHTIDVPFVPLEIPGFHHFEQFIIVCSSAWLEGSPTSTHKPRTHAEQRRSAHVRLGRWIG